jgi:predicted transglutaminase-like cysteine proteinase
MEEIKDGMSGEQQVLELAIMLGQRRAFGMMAGRCSATQAECLRKVREEKSYLKFAPNWRDFCERHLKICRRTADRAIALLKKHGALYFETAALTGITPAEFERIEDAIQQDGIHVGSDVIALIPENAARAADAVARLQAEAAAAAHDGPAASAQEQIEHLEKRGTQLCEGFHKAAKAVDCIERQWLMDAIKRVQQKINRLDLEIR